MENLAKSVKIAASDFSPPDDDTSNMPQFAEGMRTAAIEWAKACITEFRDELLRKGLAVSAAITDFLSEFESSP
jgi:hypothetical protein